MPRKKPISSKTKIWVTFFCYTNKHRCFDLLETLWFSGFILAKGCVDIAGIALRYPKTKVPLV